jgi:hypothetical protein
MKGLFNRIKNRSTNKRYLVSTIRQGPEMFETVVFAGIIFYFPLPWSKPLLAVKTHTQDEAWETHHRLALRLLTEFPPRIFQDYS